MDLVTEFPIPMFIGTPVPVKLPNLEPPGKPKLTMPVPVGTKNVALGKTVTSSDPEPTIGDLEFVTDGDKDGGPAAVVDVRATASLDEWELATTLNKPAHAPHLENFYYVAKNSQKQDDLNCPVLEAYKTCVMVLRVNDAIAEGKRIEFSPSDFEVA